MIPAASERLAGLDPNAVRGLAQAASALEAGRPDDAGAALFAIVQRYPRHPEVLRVHAGILSAFGVHDDAVAAIRTALEQRPADALCRNTAGTILATAGDYDAAAVEFRAATTLDPSLAAAWYNRGVLLVRNMRTDEAGEALRKAIELEPTHIGARVQLADLLRAANRADAADTEYREVIARSATAGMAWWGLADLKTRPFSADDTRLLERAIGDPRATLHDRIAMGFALARALDDQGRLAESLDALARAHALAGSTEHWSARGFSASLAAAQRTFETTPSVAGDLGKDVIFVVSLPRSGSTLIEQILASHSRVEGAGELPDLPLLISAETKQRGRPLAAWAAEATVEDWRRLGSSYLERTDRWRQQRPVLVDKMPSNWQYIDAIRAMLPGARIVVARRDPLEACFSCYRQFLLNNPYSHTFGDLAAYWRDFDRGASAAQARHALFVRTFGYERLIDQPEAEIRDLLAFCDLAFEPACLEFHRSQREVRTPSAMQVREPLRRDTRHALRYGALLDPLRAALGLPAFVAA
jgi:tetratricopeptide (TPR) repeat protein